jgi:fatty-acyl-CoA synthase
LSGGLLERLSARAQAAPWTPALIVVSSGGIRQFSYADLWAETEGWAARWVSTGAKPGQVVFIVLRHGWEAYAAFLGAMRAGLLPAFLPFPTPKQDPTHYWASHRALFERVKPAALLTYEANAEPLAKAAERAVLTLEAFASLAPAALAPIPAADRPAFLQHSSGTTGLKKGVQITWAQLDAQVGAYAAAIGMGPGDKVASWLPLYHDMGLVTGFLMPLSLGATIISLDPFEWVARPSLLFEAIETYGAGFCWLPNFAFAHLVRTAGEDDRHDLSSMRAFIDCSEPCRAETLDAFLDRFSGQGVRPQMLQACYAMAETVFAVSQTPMGQPPRVMEIDADRFDADQSVVFARSATARVRRLVSCGAPIAGVEARIAGDAGRAGEVEVRGEFVFDRYFANPAGTKAAFADGWYRTGDLGFLHEGELYVCGRRKEMLIVHGRNHYAGDIEEVLASTPGVKPGRAVVFAVFDPTSASEEAVALVEAGAPDADPAALKRAVKKAVYDRLELTLRTVAILPAGQLIKTTSGKVSRDENRRRYLEDRNEP